MVLPGLKYLNLQAGLQTIQGGVGSRRVAGRGWNPGAGRRQQRLRKLGTKQGRAEEGGQEQETRDLRIDPRNPFRQSREASKAQELPECLPGSLGPCPQPRAGASEQREKAASGDPSGPGPRRWATTAVSSGNERGQRAQAAALVSVSASGQLPAACCSLSHFLLQHKGP